MGNASYVLSFSCESASDFIPSFMEEFFHEGDTLWQQAERYDPYAKSLAEAWSGIAKAPLYLGAISNKVCDMDRSLRNPSVWSPWTAHAPLPIKERLLEEWYRPYHAKVITALEKQLSKGHQVLHISIRSCVFSENASSAFLNMQYSTAHSEEKHVACAFQSVVRRTEPQILLRRNSPKCGHADSFPAALRKHFARQDFLSLGITTDRHIPPTLQAQRLHLHLKKVLHGMWR